MGVQTQTKPTLRLGARIPASRANGPGRRAVLWLQGCPLSCPGCFNPHLKPLGGGHSLPVADLLEWVAAIGPIEGVSISGGEPTAQTPALIRFLEGVKKTAALSTLMFSGRRKGQIEAMTDGPRLLALLDVLVDGPFDWRQANPPGVWPSSANQRLHLLTDRYRPADFGAIPAAEIIIGAEGTLMRSGMGAVSLLGPADGQTPSRFPPFA